MVIRCLRFIRFHKYSAWELLDDVIHIISPCHPLLVSLVAPRWRESHPRSHVTGGGANPKSSSPKWTSQKKVLDLTTDQKWPNNTDLKKIKTWEFTDKNEDHEEAFNWQQNRRGNSPKESQRITKNHLMYQFTSVPTNHGGILPGCPPVNRDRCGKHHL